VVFFNYACLSIFNHLSTKKLLILLFLPSITIIVPYGHNLAAGSRAKSFTEDSSEKRKKTNRKKINNLFSCSFRCFLIFE